MRKLLFWQEIRRQALAGICDVYTSQTPPMWGTAVCLVVYRACYPSQEERLMRDVKRWLSVAAFGVSVSLTGCVSSSQFKKAQAERNQLRNEIQSARAEADDFRNQLGAVSEVSQGKDEQMTALSSANSELQAQLDEINKQYAEALEGASNPPPKAFSNELSELPRNNS